VSRYLLIGRSAEYESRLRGLFGVDLATLPAEVAADGADGLARRLPSAPAVALLGPYLSFEETRMLSQAIPAARPGTSIVVVKGERAELEDWVDAMTIDAVLSPDGPDSVVESVVHGLAPDPGTPGPVPAAAEPVEPAPPSDDERPEIVAVVAPKGGQGKTTLAINLAAGLARLAPDSVVLVDADLQFGDVANALDRTPARGWVDAVAAGADEIAFKTALHRHPSGFFVLAAPPTPDAADGIGVDQVAAVLARLARIVRYVVVDTTPGVGESTLAVLEAADQAVFVSSLSVPSLRALRTELDVLERSRLLPTRRHVVVNFVDRVSGLTVRDAERITGETVGVPIPRSSAVVLASNHGVPLLDHDPRDAAAKAILDLLVAVAPAAEAVARSARRRTR